ncbi:MAG: YIP1 family protein [Eubacteriales bacterium]|nr:YIP1 family protein [Eubacteriales bacterium]
MKKRNICIICFLVIICVSTAQVYAFEPYIGYTYDISGNVLPGPNGYTPDKSYTGKVIGTYNFNNPEDLFVYKDKQEVYIADTGNKRIVITDENFSLIKTYNTYKENGEDKEFITPRGLFVSDKGIFVADTDAEAVLMIDFDGNLIHRYSRPDDPMYQSEKFSPTKVLLDKANNLYVLSTGSYQGAVVFNSNHEFSGYLGSIPMTLSLKVLADYFWKQIMNEEQIDKMARYVPVEYNNFAVDNEGFIFTVYTPSYESSGVGAKSIFKLSTDGTDIFPDKDIQGDNYVFYSEGGTLVQTRFADICVDQDGYVNALDRTEGRIFQYDSDGNLLFIFGGIGNQKGLFRVPAAIDVLGSTIVVLDKTRNSITTFNPTEIGDSVHTAISYYKKGLYSQAEEPWREALKYNSNFILAYNGLARAEMEQFNYQEAMRYFKLGLDPAGYSKAFKQLRVNYVRENYWIFIIFITVMISIAAFWIKYKMAKKTLAIYKYGNLSSGKYVLKSSRIRNLFFVIRHPFAGFDDMSYYTTGSLGVSFILLALWIIITIISYQSTGFIFSDVNAEGLNIFIVLLQTVGLFVLWCSSNWIFSVLLGGRGTFKNIWCASSYCLVPLLISSLTAIVVSHFLILDEIMFYRGIILIGQLYAGFMLIVAMKNIHEYSLTRTIAQIILTVFGILFASFLAVLTYSLMNEVANFAKVIFEEIMFRL